MKKKFLRVISLFLIIACLFVQIPTVKAIEWNFDGITVDKLSPQNKGTSINITANTNGHTENLQYKFVWMKDNWNEWGILKEFSLSNTYEWLPETVGNYTVYVDVKDSNDAVETKTIDYEITQLMFECNKVTANKASPQKKGTSIYITADTNGNAENLQYKFVWMKDNWNEWGVLEDFSSSNTYKWTPTSVGNYIIYVDIKNEEGTINTKTFNYTISSNEWNFDSISTDKQSPIEVNSDVNINVNVSGDTENLQYKYVWMKNNWKEWGVLRDFSFYDTYNWSPKEAGDYTIYVNVKNWDKKVITKTLQYKIENIEAVKTIDEGLYSISSALNSNMVLDVYNGETSDGTNIQLYESNSTDAQKFYVSYIGNGYYTIKAKISNKMLDVKYAEVENGTNVWQYYNNETDAQKWIIKDAGNGYYYIVSKCNNLYLDVENAQTNNGTNIQVYKGNKTSAQKFKFNRIKDYPDMNFKANGIDVSLWQGNMDWVSVKNSGTDFAMIRSGYGRNEPNQVDEKFYKNVNGAKAAGVDVGVYHYSYAESAADAVNEANFCLDIIKGYKFEYPIAFDIEDESMKRLGKRELTEICKAFCNTIEAAGYYAVIYCNPDWLVNYLYSDELLGRYDLWLAHWYVDTPAYECGLWQHSDKGRVFGINGDVDLDISYKNYSSIIKSCHLNGY